MSGVFSVSSSSGLDSSMATLRDCVYLALLSACAEVSSAPSLATAPPPSPTLRAPWEAVLVGEAGSKGMLELVVLSVELTVDEVTDTELSAKESRDRCTDAWWTMVERRLRLPRRCCGCCCCCCGCCC